MIRAFFFCISHLKYRLSDCLFTDRLDNAIAETDFTLYLPE